MEPYDWEIRLFKEELQKSFKELRFSDAELRENIDAWNKFFESKGLGDPYKRKIAGEIIRIIQRSVIQGSKDNQFYSKFYPTRSPKNPPISASKIMAKEEHEGRTSEWFSGNYAAELADPNKWPDCVEDYSSCDSYDNTHLFNYSEPADIGLSYMKMSVFQLAVGKIAIEILDLFKDLYGQDLPEPPETTNNK